MAIDMRTTDIVISDILLQNLGVSFDRIVRVIYLWPW